MMISGGSDTEPAHSNPVPPIRFKAGLGRADEHCAPRRVLQSKEKTMTYVEPTPPGTPQPEIQPEPTPQPEIDPSDTPDEMPPMEPGGGGEGDSRPYGAV
jgi:hypothetical protein